MQRIKNIKQLREDLLKKYEEAENDKDIQHLTTHTATASAIIRSVKTELDYNRYQGIKDDIEFLKVKNND